MPRRMLRDWTDSERFDGISAEAERMFVRLIMKADDFGRFHGSPRLIKSLCFPLLEIETAKAGKWIKELQEKGLVILYQVGGKDCLSIPNFGQRLKESRAKFPPMDGESSDWLPAFPELPGTSRNIPAETAGSSGLKSKGREVEVEVEVEGNGREYTPLARAALHFLNEKSGKAFRESESSLEPINARLKEPGVTIEGVKQMIERQCVLWRDDPKMVEYLRPSTLFNKTKFNEYYAAKDLPSQKQGTQQGQPSQQDWRNMSDKEIIRHAIG